MRDSNSNSPNFLAPTSLPSLPALTPIKFPTFQELVDTDAATLGTPASKPAVVGAFKALLGTPEILHAAWLDNPEAYDPRLGPVLHLLLTGTTLDQLSPEQLELLNQATLEFAQYRPPPKQPAPLPVLPVKSSEPDDPDGDADERDLEWNGGSGERTRAVAAPTVTDIERLGAVPTRWWERR